jgi:hypothetical protein
METFRQTAHWKKYRTMYKTKKNKILVLVSDKHGDALLVTGDKPPERFGKGYARFCVFIPKSLIRLGGWDV